MTTTPQFTQDHPFEFEGAKVWRDADGDLKCVGGTSFEEFARVLHAFIEAESAEWHWVEEGKVARKGRWEVAGSVDGWDLTHDDFPRCHAHRFTSDARGAWMEVAQEAFDSFLAFFAAQSQPTEPTTFGYVGTVTDKGGDTWPIFRREEPDFRMTAIRERDGKAKEGSWDMVLALGTFEPKGDGR